MANIWKRLRNCKNLNTQTVWAASAYAWRINNGVNIKQDVTAYTDIEGVKHPGLTSNKRLAVTAINNPKILSEEDFQKGSLMHQYFKGLMFKAIGGKLDPFEKRTLSIVEIEDWATTPNLPLSFGILMSLPGVYERNIERQKAEDEIRNVHSTHLGSISDKVELTVRIVKCLYSKKWDTHFVTAIVKESSNVVFFANRSGLKVDAEVKIKGRIKAHRDQGQTQLNYVRILENV